MPRWYAPDVTKGSARVAINVGYGFFPRGLVAIDGTAGVVPRWEARY